ncbi:MAG: GMC family oxidoreductase [Longimicrobiales bacterium]|nr:GMC family oxidoreductase [Longimicrobiales bacterium]
MYDKRDLRHRQVVVVGSGFGGALAAWPLVRSGLDVLMVERGPWIPRGPHCWAPEGTITRTPWYESDHYAPARTDRGLQEVRSVSAVGGPSVFYGAVSMRFREADFAGDPEIVGDSGASWPIGYPHLRPYYDEVERILRVAGEAGVDPTEPPRPDAYPAPLNALSEVSARMAAAARSLGLRPFRLPLAIDFGDSDGRRPCAQCDTCDTFACAVEAKNDLATTVLAELQRRGMEIRPETAVTRLHVEGTKVTGVACRDRKTGETYAVTADTVVLAAGALGTPHLLLSSGLHELCPAGDAVGRYLTRHCSGIVFGAYSWVLRHEGRFHKQIGINDFYLGDPDGRGPKGKLGNIQQTQTPNIGTVVGETGPAVGALLKPLVRRATGLLVIAEDRPQHGNRVYLAERATPDAPRALAIEHHYDDRDLAARKRLYVRARQIHRAAGSPFTYTHTINTFSHAMGTVRMGPDPERSPLDAAGRFRGADNLYVTDGSALPTSGGLNPSLTIAANALRIGSLLAQRVRTGAEAVAAR